MAAPLVTTKFCLPILRKDRILRGRLVEHLDAGLWQEDGFVRRLTLVSAPAGFGKTTLVSEWLHQSKHRAAWLGLDETDNDPVRFLAYVIAALRQIQPDFARATEAILQLPQPPPADAILGSLVNALSALPGSFILALDDYHVIHTPAIHQELAFLLNHEPANMHVVVLTREDPLLPIARLRARGQLLELRQDDLRFSADETAEFLQRGLGRSLGSEQIVALEHRTEGWIAGLQLAVISMQGRSDVSDFIQAFTGSSRFILDYLLEEVFDGQPLDTQDFLLKTSILDRLSGPLCDAVTNRTDSQQRLERLEQANLFIVPLDSSRGWYRYHHLFADLLGHRLRLSGLHTDELHRRASQWYEAAEFLPNAVEHSLAAQDWANVARLIGMLNEAMLKHGEVVTLLNWLDRIPREVTWSSPQLCIVSAWAALLASRFDVAAPLLKHAEDLAAPGSHFLGQVASAQAFLARAQRNNVLAIEKSELALALLPDEEVATRGNIAMNLGLAYWHEGRLTEAEPTLVQSCDLSRKAGNTFALLTAEIFLARALAARGRLHEAEAALEQLVQGDRQVPILCLAHYDLATIHHEWNDLRAATGHFEKGFALSQRSGNVEFQQSGYLLHAILAHAQGDEVTAFAALAEADALARDFPIKVSSRTAALGVQLALELGDAEMLSHWSAKVNAEVDAHSFYRFMGLTGVRILIAEGKKEEASGALARLYETAWGSGWGYGLLVVRILQSLAANTSDRAVRFLSDALGAGQREGFIRSFVEPGEAIIPILQEAARHGIEPGYVRRILAAIGAANTRQAPERARLVEPLSERELEVLRLVTAGLSNREIAERLVVSLGTAKTHIHHLCGKLGARNRTEAVAKAREIGLLE